MDIKIILEVEVPKLEAQYGRTAYTDHLEVQVAAGQSRQLDANGGNHIFIQGSPPAGLKIESGNGIYDAGDAYAEMQVHAHKGPVTITNSTRLAQTASFVQASFQGGIKK